MQIKDLLKVIQAQRHDFLNHLQVISGLVQLGKIDRVNEYIGEVCMNMGLMSLVNRIKIPEISAALMIGHNLAFEQQVQVEYRLEDELGDTVLPAEMLADMLIHMQKIIFDLAAAAAEVSTVTLIMERLKNNYICRLQLKIPDEIPAATEQIFEELQQIAKVNMGLDNGRLEITNLNDTLELALIFRKVDINKMNG
ncbi:signal transduction histidine kinase regulating citrate/malate metabolism [Desulfofarcimen acetoxidans DSM 771]|uniref:Signal transduction histidine kinase regulating citrate/malate metabolism n=1 Tax=Desulfofarcimen acetoxidans (strain ATCC 49208 / DSM 771 / KCTC 5769 / VKM B-1644 / 5575) TaxID=485916 RepID=C8W5P4_DESAS|nr:Spo0B domain-containing protein [Desulfofarcimen acetoxidans]ACV64044.1 signal transduction histidine kinase regulating citrate/malate metabolism [Desulfofarcimen acetoxidans DSM 771]